MTKGDIQINSRFKEAQKRITGASSLLAFAHAIRGQNFLRGTVSKGFYRLVSKNDYGSPDEEEVLESLQTMNASTGDVLAVDSIEVHN